MTTLSIQPPFPLITDIDGQPLEDGYIWIGTANLPPIGNPIAVYWDAALTIPAALPIRTRGGYPVNAGTPARLYVNSDYSILVQNKNGSMVYSAPAATERIASSLITGLNASQVVYDPAGTNAVPTTVQAKLRETVSVLDFGAVGDGVADDTAAIQAAATYAINNGFGAVYLPTGVYVVGSTINMGRMCLLGDGDGSRIRPTISDGSAVLSFAAGTNFFFLDSFRIDNGLTLSNFISGAINAQNCTGIKVISSGGSFSARYIMRDVVVRGCKVGYDINGFIGTLDNVWSLACETGLIGTLLNSVRAHLRFEECRKDFAITASFGLHLDQLLSEGGVLQSGLVASTIDGCVGVRLSVPYFEQTRNVPFVSFGGTTLCKSITIDGLTLANADGSGKDNNVFMLTFDNVDGLEISGRFSTGAQNKRYSVTSNTKNIVDTTTSISASTWHTDNSKNLSVVKNYFPNSDFELWLRGWPAVSVIRGAISKETSIVRRGNNSVKFTPTVGQSNGYVNFVFNDALLPIKLRGKTLTMYSWVFIPDIAEFTSVATRPAVVQLETFRNGTGGGTTSTSDSAGNRGQWNLLEHTFSIPADCTQFELRVRVLRNTGTTTGNEVFYVDSVYLIEGDGGQDFSVVNGNIVDSPLNPCVGLGGLATIMGDAVPVDTDQIYEVGDRILKFTVAAGGSPGWVCTTAGAGGTAVFKAMANVAA